MRLFNLSNCVSFVCIVVTVFVFAEVFKQIFVALLFGDSYQHFAICLKSIFQVGFVGIKGGDFLGVFVFDQLERRHFVVVLGDVNIEAVVSEIKN